ncbi:hypothetical protein V1477_000130 [Vespula maculifrons]|uniref:Uncharacterized protein n=1 Tax=Vespula maculifrons TaxID=7453 RepID=A0ABD2D3J5_VESMC
MEQHAEANEIPTLAIQYETEEEHEQEYNEESQNVLASHKSFNKSNPTNSLVMSCATKQSEKKITWRSRGVSVRFDDFDYVSTVCGKITLSRRAKWILVWLLI